MYTLLIAALGLSLLASPARALQESDYAKLNKAAIEQHVQPRYKELQEASGVMHKEAEAFCAVPDQARLPRLQQAYRAAAGAWQDIQHVRFGPVDLFFRSQRIAFWPDQRNTVSRQTAELLAKRDLAALQAERLARGSVAVQGLPPMERLLFGDEAPKLVETGPDQAFRCRYLVALAANQENISREVFDEWQGLGSNGRELSLDLFKSLYTAVELIADHKLARPLGASVAQARPRSAESWRSESSLEHIRRNLAAGLDLYRVAFAPVVPNSELNQAILRGFERSLNAANAVLPSLETAVEKPALRPAVEALAAEVLALKTLLVQRLPAALDLPLGFNALDGD